MSGEINLLRRFQALTPEPPFYTGAVDAIYGESARVLLESGGYLIAQNPLGVAVGKKVFVQSHKITGEAPDLPYSRVEI